MARPLEEFDRFLRRMQPGNLVLTTLDGKIYLGQVAGPDYFTESADGLSNLRLDVTWYESQRPIGAAELEPPMPALLQSQAYVVELTEAYRQLAAFVPNENKTAVLRVAAPAPQRELAFHPVTGGLADELLLD